jgi:tetratricopeptide (TPR) repeat protein
MKQRTPLFFAHDTLVCAFLFFTPLIIAHDSHHAEAASTLGALYEKTGNTDQAVNLYKKAIATEPTDVKSEIRLGDLQFSKKEYQEALEAYKKALALDGKNAHVRYQIALCYKHLNNTHAAINELKRLINQDPKHVNALHQLGILYREQEELDKSADYLATAHEVRPSDLNIAMELANTLNMLNRDAESMALYIEVLNANPNITGALYNFGYTLKKQGLYHRALEVYDKVLAQKSDYALARFSRANTLLTLGDFAQGFDQYEWRFKAYNESPEKFSAPLLNCCDESIVNGKTILLCSEQGLGDTLQFIRYAQLLKRDGARVVVEAQDALVPLLKLCPYIDVAFGRSDAVPCNADYHIPLLSLPRLYKTEIATIPHEIPYLSADEQLVDYWHEELSHDQNFKVGICWQGNANYSTLALRQAVAAKSLPIALLAQLSEVPNVTIYSLQQVHGTEQLADVDSRYTIKQFGAEFDTLNGRFMDSAAVIKNLDLIISVDTSIGHLAGGLGAQTWILLPHVADWRWLLNRTDSPWYPTVRLFRQSTSGDWQQLIDRVKKELDALVNDPAATHNLPDVLKVSALDMSSIEQELPSYDVSHLFEQIEHIVKGKVGR